jgi:dihydrofolate reductase
MRQLILHMITSIDGFISTSDGQVNPQTQWDEQMQQHYLDLSTASGGAVFGRNLYQPYVGHWSKVASGQIPAETKLELAWTQRLTAMDKYVISNTLTDAERGTQVLSGDIAGQIQRIKQANGGDLLILGQSTYSEVQYSSAATRLQSAQNGDDLADDDRAVGHDRRVCGVVRDQPDMPVDPLERLDCRLAVSRRVAFEHGGDNVAVLDVRLAADNHPVAVSDRGVDHRVADDPEHDEVPLPDQLLWQRDNVLNQLVYENRAAGRDPPHERHWRHPLLLEFLPPQISLTLGGRPKHGRARPPRLAAQVSLSF